MEKIPKEIVPFYDFAFMACLPICENCGDDPEFPSEHPKHSDEWYLDQAIGLKDAGWVIPELHEGVCRKCAETEGIQHDPELYTEVRNLQKANLMGENLEGVDFSYCDFSEANLRKAKLAGANLQGAKFHKTRLSTADASGADLSGVDLSGAECIATNFTGTNLTGTTFDRASVSKAVMIDADLRGADMNNVINLTCQQLQSARIDKTTRLPDYIKIEWRSDTEYDCGDRVQRIGEK